MIYNLKKSLYRYKSYPPWILFEVQWTIWQSENWDFNTLAEDDFVGKKRHSLL